jgi:tRNA/rRNA methyltransferase
MSYKNIYFILVRPQLGENIGATARALKNFKLSKLRIVNPRSGWPNQKAIATSVGAKSILQSSKIYNSLDLKRQLIYQANYKFLMIVKYF